MRPLQIPCHIFRFLAGSDWNGQFMMPRQRRLILSAGRLYALIQNRLFGLVQFFAIHNNIEMIAAARSNCKLHRASPHSPEGFYRRVKKASM